MYIGVGNVSVPYKLLESDTYFLATALAQSKVSVWYREYPDPIGQLMDYGGIVEGYTPESIKIAGTRFVRRQFEFRAKVSK